jgi:hypothetical protein
MKKSDLISLLASRENLTEAQAAPDRAIGIYRAQGRNCKRQENRNQGVRQLRDAGVCDLHGKKSQDRTRDRGETQEAAVLQGGKGNEETR